VNYNSLGRRATQPGHWSRPVTQPSQLGPAQPMWAELGPAPKTKKNKK